MISVGPILGQAPSEIQFQKKNKISTNSFSNYFTYDAKIGEKIIIHITFDSPLLQQWKTRCSGNPSAYYSGITINSLPASCDEDLIYTFEEDGMHTFAFSFPDGEEGFGDISGFFEAAVVDN